MEAETRYSVIDLEALALVESVWAFAYQPELVCAQAGGYDFTLCYKQGASNHVPDLLSRPGGTPTPPADEACLVEQPLQLPLSDPPEQLQDNPDITTLEPKQMKEYQLRDSTCEDLLK